MPEHFSREDVQRHLCEIGEHTRMYLQGGCQLIRELDYLIVHQDDPAFIDRLMVELADFDPTTYWLCNQPDYVGNRPYRPATAGDIDTALYFRVEEVAQDIAKELVAEMWAHAPDLSAEAVALRKKLDRLQNEVGRLLKLRESIIARHDQQPSAERHARLARQVSNADNSDYDQNDEQREEANLRRGANGPYHPSTVRKRRSELTAMGLLVQVGYGVNCKGNKVKLWGIKGVHDRQPRPVQ